MDDFRVMGIDEESREAEAERSERRLDMASELAFCRESYPVETYKKILSLVEGGGGARACYEYLKPMHHPADSGVLAQFWGMPDSECRSLYEPGRFH